MTEKKEKKNTAHGPRSKERFEREAKALQKNLQKQFYLQLLQGLF